MTIDIKWAMDMGDLRNFCIRHNYYTCGDCRAYDILLTSLREEFNQAEDQSERAETLFAIASDIFTHSEDAKVIYKLSERDEMIEEIMFLLIYEHVVRQSVNLEREV